jgi:hypothetical protein
MLEISIFTNKESVPTDENLKDVLGSLYSNWLEIRNYALQKYPKAMEEWNFTGKKYGWTFRIKDNKRAILYFLPREAYFEIAFVFGKKAYQKILNSQISSEIKKDIELARVYAEGRGIRIEIKDDIKINDIKTLIDIKLEK